MNDQELLRVFAHQKSPDAFAELVTANADQVYAAACRQLRDPHLAEDVTQAVFVLLAKKAGVVRGPVAGWLIKATYFCCRDAKRLAARRAYHERQAMAMRPTATAASVPEEIIDNTNLSHVDAALLRLRMNDRDAITLRYLKGMSLQQVGTVQGIGEEAARKRVDRAIERLRGVLGKKGAVSAAALSASLASASAHAAPIGLANSIVLTAGSAAKGSVAAGIAHAAAKWMWWAQMKWAAGTAAAIAIVGMGAGAGLVLHSWHAPTPPVAPVVVALASAPSVPAAPSAAIPVDPYEDETHVPGQMQLAFWDVLLDASELPSLQKIATPLDSPSKIYQAYRFTGSDLRHAIKTANDAGKLIRSSVDMEIGAPRGNDSALHFEMPPYFQHLDTEGQRIMVLGGSPRQNDTFIRSGSDRLHLKLDHPDFQVKIALLTGNTQWINQPGQSLVYEGDLAPGQAVAFVATLPMVDDRTFVHVIVWESFQADPSEVEVAQYQRDARWWCENGPSRLRHWADAARVWTAKAAEHPVVAAPFEKKLEDGKVLRLEALCRPSKWPYCWWDAQGNPVHGQNGMLSFTGDPPEGLYAYVTLSGGAPDEEARRNPTNSNPGTYYGEVACEQIDDASPLELGIAVGPWKTLATLELNKPQTFDGVDYLIRRPKSFGDTQFLVHFVRTGVLENDDLLAPTASDGKVASTYADPTMTFQHPTEPEHKETQPNFHDLSLAKVTRYQLLQRKRAWVTLPEFATMPKEPPPSAATWADAHQAENARKELVRQTAAVEIDARRKEWATIAPDRKTIPGAVRALVNAVRAGNENAVRQMLVATKPAAQHAVDVVARLLLAQDAANRVVVAKLGHPLSQSDVQPLMSDGGYQLLDLESEFYKDWSPSCGMPLQVTGYQFQKTNDGMYAVNLDSVADLTDPQRILRQQVERMNRIREKCLALQSLTIDELRTILQETRQAPPATAPVK